MNKKTISIFLIILGLFVPIMLVSFIITANLFSKFGPLTSLAILILSFVIIAICGFGVSYGLQTFKEKQK